MDQGQGEAPSARGFEARSARDFEARSAWGDEARSAWGVADFRRLWLIGLLVSVARWLEMLVVGVVVWQQTASAFLVAGMTLLRLLPMGLFGALLGVAMDRVQRHTALLALLLTQGATAAMLAWLALGGQLAVWQLAVAAFLGGTAWAADNPVRRMMLGEIVGVARMGTAMSWDVMANNASRIAGPVLGGSLLAAWGAGPAFALCCALYCGTVPLALRVRYRSRPQRRGGLLRDMRGSFARVLAVPRMRGVMVVTVVFNLFGFPATSMVPVIGAGSLGLGPGGVGVLAAMDGVGALAGAGLVALLGRPGWQAPIFRAGTALYCAMVAGFALAPGPVTAGLALLVLGIGGAGFSTMQATLVYTLTPPELRSRALGVLSACIGLGLLGFLHLGLLAQWLGAPAATALIGVEGVCALALTRRWWRDPG